MLLSSSSNSSSGHLSRRAALVTGATALALALGACSGSDDDDNATTHTATDRDSSSTNQAGAEDFGRYVALGDSFAAFGGSVDPTTGPAACMRSTSGYPSLIAEDPAIGEFVDATCGGATTVDMTQAQIAETPPQFDALTADTDLVTLSIGGNDMKFGALVQCIGRTSRDAADGTCHDRLGETVSQALDALPASLDEVYRGIGERAPEARVITTAYMPLVPAHGFCDFVSGMSPEDVTWVREITERINTITGEAAARAGATFVMPPGAEEHHACAPVAGRYTDFTGHETSSHPMHPTGAGQRAMAEAVIAEF